MFSNCFSNWLMRPIILKQHVELCVCAVCVCMCMGMCIYVYFIEYMHIYIYWCMCVCARACVYSTPTIYIYIYIVTVIKILLIYDLNPWPLGYYWPTTLMHMSVRQRIVNFSFDCVWFSFCSFYVLLFYGAPLYWTFNYIFVRN